MEWLLHMDRHMFKVVHVDWHHPILDAIFWLFSTSGFGHVHGPMLLTLTNWRQIWNKQMPPNPYRGWFWPCVGSFACAGIFNQLAFKNLVPRERPSNLIWAKPQEAYLFDSFASGHTVSSMGIAFCIFFLTRDRKEAPWGWYALIWAGLVGVSRIYRGVHWPTDVLGAILQGCFWGALFAWLASKNVAEITAETSSSEGT